MQTFKIILPICALGLTLAWSSFAVATPTWIDFYWHPTSPLPSGQASIQQLHAHLLGVVQIPKGRSTQETSDSVWLQDLDLSRQAVERHTGHVVTLSKCEGDWCWITFPQIPSQLSPSSATQNPTHSLIPIHRAQLSPWPKDLGVAITWRDSYLLTLKPTQRKPVTKGERFSVVQFFKNWAYVMSHRPPFLTGYLPLEDVITKYHLVEFALWKNYWHPVERVSSEGFRFKNLASTVPFAEVSAVLTQAQKQIARDFASAEEPPRSVRWAESPNRVTWFKSRLPEHGVVYWKKPYAIPPRAYTLDELVQGGARLIAESQNDEGPVLVSHHGVFYSPNKKTLPLQRLDFFSRQTWPVHIDSQDRLYVGYWISNRAGPSPVFEPMISWQILSRFFKDQTLPHLKLLKVQVQNEEVHLDISSGKRTWRLSHSLATRQAAAEMKWWDWRLASAP
jgi:hypothetical protein